MHNAVEKHLRARQSELQTRLDRATADLQRANEPLVADFADQAVQRENDDVLKSIIDAARVELLQVGEALARVQAGRYGVCEACGATIEARRLEAVPYAALCAHCAEVADSPAARSGMSN